MKKIILLTAFMLSLCNYLMAQKAPYKVVFDVTSKDSVVHQMVIRWIREIETTNPEAEIEALFKDGGMERKMKLTATFQPRRV